MKKLQFMLVLLMASSFTFAQDSIKQVKKEKNKDEIRSIFSHPEKGGFFSLNAGITSITDQQQLMAGMRFGITLDHWFSYGLGGNILVTQPTYDNLISNKTLKLEMGYAGLFVEPCIGPKMPFHFSFPILVGIGTAFYLDNANQNYNNHNGMVTVDNDIFYIIEPGAEIELNFTKHTRICLGVKFRFTSDLQLINTSSDAFDGLLYGLTIKLGKF